MNFRSSLRALAIAALALGTASCGEDLPPVAPRPAADISSLFWRVRLNHRAILLSRIAPLDTVRLVATPYTMDGTPIDAPDAVVTFASSDSTRLVVSPDGLVRARNTVTRGRVTVRMTIGEVTLTDTAVVTITSVVNPSPLTTFSVQPVPPATARVAQNIGGGFPHYPPGVLPLRALNASNGAIAGLVLSVETDDPNVATVNPMTRAITGRKPGSVWFRASTYAYGVARQDSVEYTVGLPNSVLILPKANTTGPGYRFSHSTIRVTKGAYVGWIWTQFYNVPRFEVLFEDPTNVAADMIFCRCGAGNIPLVVPAPAAAGFMIRHFPVAGTYHYTSPALGASATIIVEDETPAPPPAAAP